MSNTDALSDRLVRLPMWVGLDENINQVIDVIGHILTSGMLQ
jgi:dTDP-4-amino-4,6-dideoxygalactose transaminase